MRRAIIPATLIAVLLSVLAPAAADASTGDRRWAKRQPRAVPELALGAAGAAVVLIGGALAVAHGRRKKKI